MSPLVVKSMKLEVRSRARIGEIPIPTVKVRIKRRQENQAPYIGKVKTKSFKLEFIF